MKVKPGFSHKDVVAQSLREKRDFSTRLLNYILIKLFVIRRLASVYFQSLHDPIHFTPKHISFKM